MSTSENKHVTAAQDYTGWEIADRQVQATLALAYEQRTANLIALYAAPDLANRLERSEWDSVEAQIKERLGL